MSLQLFLYLVAVVLLVLAAFGVPARRVSLGWLGLAVWLFAAGILPALT
ncbi:hypothetical protein ABGB07_02260 [Micromonosporaceae bacterium B7E4]